MNAVDIKAELKNLIDRETDLNLLEQIKALITHSDYNSSIEKEMISTALKSEEDIKNGRVYMIEEVEDQLKKRLDI
jgi:hypothetical protein